MVDQPSDSARSNTAGGTIRPISQFEVEWKDGLSRLMSNLEAELERTVQAAHRQASDAVKGIESQGLDLLTLLDQRQSESEAAEAAAQERTRANIAAAEEEIRQARAAAERETAAMVAQAEQRAGQLIADAEERYRAAEAEHGAVQERVIQIQASIDAADEELRQNREDAEREAAEVVTAARRRAESIIARAEAQADEIVNEARAEVAARRARPGSDRSGGGAAVEGGGGDLRDLSARVGALLSTPGGTAAGTAAAVGLGAAGVAAAVSRTSGPTAPEEPLESDTPAEPEALAADEPEAAGYEEGSPTRVVTSSSAGPEPPAAYEPPAPSSWAADDDADETNASESETVSMPSASASSGPEPYQDAEPIYMRRAPQPEPAMADEEPEPESAPTPVDAAHNSPEEPVAAAGEDAGGGPSGAVTQTIIFQAVPNFQAALALERSLKAMSEVREVRVADFDERQLTFQVTHELGAQLPRVLLSQRAGELEFVEAKPERVEFVFRS